jgi:hypothetical protein
MISVKCQFESDLPHALLGCNGRRNMVKKKKKYVTSVGDK